MTSSPAPTSIPCDLASLEQAAHAYTQRDPNRPSPRDLTATLLAAEAAAKRPRPTLAAADLGGTWQLCFTAPNKPRYHQGKPTGGGFYLPRLGRATLRLAAEGGDSLSIQNQLEVGGLALRFQGPARLQRPQNLLVFTFNQVSLHLGERTLLQRPIDQKNAAQPFAERSVGTLPFFALFALTPTALAARGRGGGLALWRRIA